ncbi:ABC transporter permease [Leptospira mtsangambouensis]|uniref:Transport permease protein n=1 Tax=Leptospira mtsangambouensis TaxID=2484912 RepID=A0ABY2P4B4_9LEPT|nr:ABC transporter permease [Leptospira mtsangambouensis]TGM82298.1 ABC transporter permease [Leptospira mtsangambouensis]
MKEIEITNESKWYKIDIVGIYEYRDLLWLLVKRDFVAFYKQTVLGPLWYIIQPIFTSLTMTIIFSNIANISTDGIHPFLFYLSASTLWSFFSEALTKTSNTFLNNSGLFGKVFFPRMIVPISTVLITYLKLFLQVALLGVFYFALGGSSYLNWNSFFNFFVLIPLVFLQVGLFALGFGIFLSSYTTKYRDLVFALSFGISLMMYASPVIYPVSMVPVKYLDLYMLNPISSNIEVFRYSLFGVLSIQWYHWGAGWLVTFLFLLLGMITFNKVEKNFMDTI